ncbi:MAG: hypothetical protein ACJ72Z_04315 [Pyrinomonadaceae bacterium]
MAQFFEKQHFALEMAVAAEAARLICPVKVRDKAGTAAGQAKDKCGTAGQNADRTKT